MAAKIVTDEVVIDEVMQSLIAQVDSENDGLDAMNVDSDRELTEQEDSCPENWLDTTEFLSTKESDQYIQNRKPVSHLPGKLPYNRKGSYFYVLDEKALKDLSDVTFDSYRPWSTKNEVTGVKNNPRWTKSVKQDGTRFRTQKTRHPFCFHFKRMIRFDSDISLKPIGPVFVQYVLEKEDLELPATGTVGRSYEKPSTIALVQEASHRRSAAQTKEVLREMGVEVKKRTIAHVRNQDETCVKMSTGPRVATDMDKLTGLSMKTENTFLSSSKSESGKKNVRIISFCKEAIDIFLKACPGSDQLLEHRRRIGQLDNMNEKEKLDFLNSLCSETSNSQGVEGFGSFIMTDTTFLLSHLYLTVVLGTVPSFVNKANGKVSTVILGFMLHSLKTAETHRAFGEEFAKMLDQADNEKRIPLLVTDREPALSEILQGDVCSEAKHMYCDVHLRTNMKSKFGEKETERLWKFLFGRKVDGILERGLLGAVTEAEYAEQSKIVLRKEPELAKWIRSRKYKMYYDHSLRGKLESGFHGSVLTTNLLEGKNCALKKTITSMLPGEKLFVRMIDISTEIVSALRKALAGQSEDFRLEKPLAKSWDSLDDDERDVLSIQYGFHPKQELSFSIASKCPSWLIEDMKAADIEYSSTMKVVPDDDTFLVRDRQKKNRVTAVSLNAKNVYECCGELCGRSKSKKVTPCIHILAVILNVPSMEKMWQQYELERDRENGTAVLKRNISRTDGTKRKGHLKSKTNETRRILSYANSSVLDSSSSGLDSSTNSDITLETPLPEPSSSPAGSEFEIRSKRSRTVKPRKSFSPPL